MKLREPFSFPSQIKQGAILNTAFSLTHLAKYEITDVDISVKPKKKERIRTESQNNTWHGFWLYDITDYFKHYPQTAQGREQACMDVKESMGLCHKEISPMGNERIVCPSTRNYSSTEMSEFLTNAKKFMEEFTEGKLILKDPDPALSTTRLIKEPVKV